MPCWREGAFLGRCADVCRDCPGCKVKDDRIRWLAEKVTDLVELLHGRAYLRLPPPGDDPWDTREPVNESRQ
jgi:hypothetical protein